MIETRQTATATMTGGEAAAECLRRAGVRHAFCVPGESYLGLLDALHEDDQITVVGNRQESGACYAAEAMAKLTGQVGVCLVTRAPGASNAAVGIHAAMQDSTPLLLLVGQVPRSTSGREASQEVDLKAMFAPLAKWVCEVPTTERIPELVGRALHLARSGRPGPVVVSLPHDVLHARAEMTIENPALAFPPGPDPDGVALAGQWLRDARRVALIAGAGIGWAAAHDELVEVSERFAAGVFVGYQRQDLFPNGHPNYLGQLGGFEVGDDFRGEQLRAVGEADTVLAVGTRLSQDATHGYALPFAGQRLIHVDVEPRSVVVQRQPDLALISDARSVLKALARLPGVSDEQREERAAWIASLRKRARRFHEPRPVEGVDNALAITDLRAALPADAVITVDAGNFQEWLHRYFSFPLPGTFVGNGSGTMGYALPAALAAKLVHPERPVVAVCGDGGFMMTVQELETAARLKANLIVLIFNNDMHGSIRMNQEAHFPGRVTATDVGNPDFVDLARAFGAHGERATTNEELRAALARALGEERPSVIELVTDRDQLTVDDSLEDIRRRAES
jgi:acetolactate synthase-1/2/3 large subunit